MRGGYAGGLVFVFAIGGFVLVPPRAEATPPHYCTFERRQTVDHFPDGDEVLRIWVVYVGQGDGIFVELPPRLSYAPAAGGEAERIELLVDAGAYRKSDQGLMTEFLRRRFPEGVPLLEHVVVSHHDMDHVAGVTHLLRQPDVGVETIYHNGLASYVGGKGLFRDDERPPNGAAVHDWDGEKERLHRGMTFVRPGGDELEAEYLVADREGLEADEDAGLFQGVYRSFVESNLGESAPRAVGDVVPLVAGAPFVTAREAQRVPASTTFDFADREATLAATSPAGTQPVVTSSAYLPSGPLASLALGIGATETRTFTSRYFPASIALDAARDRTYAYTMDAIARDRIIKRCFGGKATDLGHELAQQQAWQAVGNCQRLIDGVMRVAMGR